MLEKRGIAAAILETPGAPVAVYGERRVKGAKRTLLFYAHFDGQPVGPEDAWKSPPFEPALRAGRAEDGAPVIPWAEAKYPLAGRGAHLCALVERRQGPDRRDARGPRRARCREDPAVREPQVLPRGRGGGGLAEPRPHPRDASRAPRSRPLDLRRRPDRPARAAAARARRARRRRVPTDRVRPGDVAALRPLRQRRAESRARGSRRSSPSMRAADGAHHDRRALRAAAFARDARARARALSTRPACSRRPESAPTESGLEYGASILRPSLNVTQLLYGGAGAQRNAIDAEATAGFDLRLVPGMTVAGAREAIEAHVKKQGYALLDAPPTAEERLRHATSRALRLGRRRLPGRDVATRRIPAWRA